MSKLLSRLLKTFPGDETKLSEKRRARHYEWEISLGSVKNGVSLRIRHKKNHINTPCS